MAMRVEESIVGLDTGEGRSTLLIEQAEGTNTVALTVLAPDGTRVNVDLGWHEVTRAMAYLGHAAVNC